MNRKSMISLVLVLVLLFLSLALFANAIIVNHERVHEQKNTLSPKDRISYSDYWSTENQIVLNAKCLKTNIIGNTGSMRPVLDNSNTIIYITCFERNDLKVGDFIVFYADWYGATITHQLIEIRNDSYVTQGVNNPNPDVGIVKFEDIKGIVIGVFY